MKLSKIHARILPPCALSLSDDWIMVGGKPQLLSFELIKDVQVWQFLTIEAAETWCKVCLPPEEHIFRKKYLGNRPFKKSHFVRV